MTTCINAVYRGAIPFNKKDLILIKKPISIYIILLEVSDYTGVSIEQMKSASRKHECVKARSIAVCMILKYIPAFTLAKIGKLFNRDHTTIIHSRDTADDLLFSSRDFKAAYKTIEATLVSKYDIKTAQKN